MTLGRPKSEDSPQKYEETYRLYLLSGVPREADLSAIEDLAACLEWAIARCEPGFCVGDIVNVSGLALGLDKSRNTAGKAVDALVQKGMLVQNKPKSPYVIVSRTPIFADSGVVADEQISLTTKFSAPSLITEVRQCSEKGCRLTEFLQRELAGSADPLVREAAQDYWRRGRFQYYLRLRTTTKNETATGTLLEVTFLNLPPDAAACFADGVARLRSQQVTQISLYPLLEQCGLRDNRAGRSHATVAETPALLMQELGQSVATADIDARVFEEGRPLLKWTYGIFRPEAEPMITFSVCYVCTDLLSIFIRNLDVELS